MKNQKIYSKYKEEYGIDDVHLFNQPIAEEGVLEYIEGGKVVKKLKRWKDLKANIGRIVPIVDDHPPEKNGKGGLINKEKIYGFAKIKKCPHANKLLCGDPILEDNSPIKKGYSIGFVYDPNNTPGKLKDQPYDQIQSDLMIDHIALTNHPRSSHAIAVAGDTIDGITTINKLILDYDLFKFSSDNENSEVKKNMPNKRFDQIMEKLKSDNPETDEAELTKRANQILDNEKDQEEEEKKKKEGDTLLSQADMKELIARNSRLEAEINTRKDSDSKIENLQKQLDAKTVASDRYKKLLEVQLNKENDSNLDRLKTVYNFDAKEFHQKSPEFISGCLYGADRIKEGVKTKRSVDGDSVDSSLNPDGTIDHNSYRYDFDTGKMKKVDF